MKIPHPFSPFPVWSEKGVLVKSLFRQNKPEHQNTAQDTRVGEDASVDEEEEVQELLTVEFEEEK